MSAPLTLREVREIGQGSYCDSISEDDCARFENCAECKRQGISRLVATIEWLRDQVEVGFFQQAPVNYIRSEATDQAFEQITQARVSDARLKLKMWLLDTGEEE